MPTTTIPLEGDAATAQAFSAASDEERRKLQLLLGIRLRELMTHSPRSLNEVMQEISRNAQARGLTPEILESLLREDPAP